MEPRLKPLISRLARAIDQSLSESKAIAHVIGEIKEEGYDVILLLEAMIGFQQKSQPEDKPSYQTGVAQDLNLGLTEQDQEFLKMIRVKVDE